MTIAAAAASAVAGRTSGPRLATPGAVLLLAGLALLYWGTGIFRGETVNTGGPSFGRNMVPQDFPKADATKTPYKAGPGGSGKHYHD